MIAHQGFGLFPISRVFSVLGLPDMIISSRLTSCARPLDARAPGYSRCGFARRGTPPPPQRDHRRRVIGSGTLFSLCPYPLVPCTIVRGTHAAFVDPRAWVLGGRLPQYRPRRGGSCTIRTPSAHSLVDILDTRDVSFSTALARESQ